MKSARVYDFVKEGVYNLLRNKTRSSLTLLGVVFGIAAVITMMGIGEGAQRTVLRQIAGLGLRNIIVESVRPTQVAQRSSNVRRERLNYGITFKDVKRIEAAYPDGSVAIGHQVLDKVHYRGKMLKTRTMGVHPEYFQLTNARLLAGTGLAEQHDQETMKVAVINDTLVEGLHAFGSAIGEKLKIGNKYFEIVGVVRVPAHHGERRVYLPYRTAFTSFGTEFLSREAGSESFTKLEVGEIVVRVADENDVKPVSMMVRSTLENTHTLNDFKITVPLQILESKQQTQRILNLVLITIACISLVVGGIGIMNITLASVSERIPEIGIRRAVGATRRDILLQFLAETTVLSVCGGIIGCLLGFMAVPLASRWTGWDGIITPSSVILSLIVSLGVGIFFGLFPAMNAARMDPGAALRYE